MSKATSPGGCRMHVPSIFRTATMNARSASSEKQASRGSIDADEAGSNDASPRLALCSGSPALIGMFRALARGNEQDRVEGIANTEDEYDESADTEAGATTMVDDETLRRQSYDTVGIDGVYRIGKDGRGEKIGPIETAAPTAKNTTTIMDPVTGITTSTEPLEKQTPIPSFYRISSTDPSDLSQRLAVLSVNQYTTNDQNGDDEHREVLTGEESSSPQETTPTGDRQQEIAAKAEEIHRMLTHIDAQLVHAKLSKDVKDKTSPSPGRRLFTDEAIMTGSPKRKDDASGSRSPSSPATPEEQVQRGIETVPDQPITDEEKLGSIQEEFGDIAGLQEGHAPERFVAQSEGALFRGIIIVGVIHLTTHRMTFHAMMPPPHSIQNENGYTDGQTTVIHAGPVTIRRQHNIYGHKKSRVWMELTGEMCTTYPSADETGRVRPIRSVLLSTIKRIYSIDTNRPCDIRFRYTTGTDEEDYRFTVDTQESALEWHRQLEAAMFEHSRARGYVRLLAKRAQRRQRLFEQGGDAAKDEAVDPDMYVDEDNNGWELLRVCLPLDRIVDAGCEDYMNFARILALEVDVADPEGSTNDLLHCADEMESLYPMNPYPGYKPCNTQLKEGGPVMPPVKRTNSLVSRLGLSKLTRTGPRSSSTAPSSDDEHGGMQNLPRGATLGIPIQRSYAAEESQDDQEQPWCDAEDRARQSSAPETLAQVSPPKPLDDDKLAIRTVSFRFAVLNQRAQFALAFLKTLKEVERLKRQYKPGQQSPLPVIDIGRISLCELAMEEGEDLQGPIGIKVPKAPERNASKPFLGRFTKPLRPAGEADEGMSGPSDDENEEEDKHGHLREADKRRAEAANAMFGMRPDESVWIKRCYLNRHVPARGHIILSDRFLCFWRKTLSDDTDIKYRFPVHDIKGATPVRAFRIRLKGMAVQIAGQQDLIFEFFDVKSRDETIAHINGVVTTHSEEHQNSPAPSPKLQPRQSSDKSTRSSSLLYPPTRPLSATDTRSIAAGSTIFNRPVQKPTNLSNPSSLKMAAFDMPDEAISHLPLIINKKIHEFRKPRARVFALLTIGSRGDVQPYVALALRLMNDGHKVVIVTHDEFKQWIEGYGIEHREAGGDPAALMKLSVEHKILSPGFFKESISHFRQWLDDLLGDAWEACKDADVIVESPSMMCGVHIAEALHVPYFRAFTMPWTRTSAYPQAFMVPAFEMGPGFNYSTYVLFDNIIWKATAPQINRWRRKMLHIKPTDLSRMSQTKIPMMYNFSSAVVPKPLDWHDDVTITGYWNLEIADKEWTPPEALVNFMEKARDDGKPLVYIGFGSIVVPHPDELTKNIIAAALKADVRAIVAKGWSSRGQDSATKEGEDIKFPPECYSLDKIPHGWLFPRIDAALHHGGAGTVGASLRAGIPTLVKPWFGDQFFWALRVTKLGAGLKVASTSVDDIATALTKASKDVVMKERAAMVGEKIRAEDGVENAVKYIYAHLIRAGLNRRHLQWQK